MNILTETDFTDYLSRTLDGKSIAVVGSSSKLLNSEHGKSIDAHDVVFRFNDADPAGFVQYTGTKTSVRVVNCLLRERHRKFLLHRLEPTSVVLCKAANHSYVSDLSLSNQVIYYALDINSVSYRLLDEFLKTDYRSVYGKPIRTGFALLAYLVLQVKVPALSVYGFDLQAADCGPVHFYNDGRRFEHIRDRYNLHHCPMDVELKMLNLFLSKCPGVSCFN